MNLLVEAGLEFAARRESGPQSGGGTTDPRVQQLNNRISRAKKAGKVGSSAWHRLMDEREQLHEVS